MKKYLLPIIAAAASLAQPIASYASDHNHADVVALDNRYNNYSYRSGNDGDISWYFTVPEYEKKPRVLYLTQRYDNTPPWMMWWSFDEYGWVGMTWLDDWHWEKYWHITYQNKDIRTQVRCNYTIRNVGSAAFMYSNVEEFYYFILTNDLSRDDRYHQWGQNTAETSHMERIERYAFAESKIKYMEIGPKVTRIGEFAFYNCSALERVTSFNPEPPVLDGNVFHASNWQQATLVVPNGALKKYRESPWWNMFATIKNMDGYTYETSDLDAGYRPDFFQWDKKEHEVHEGEILTLTHNNKGNASENSIFVAMYSSLDIVKEEMGVGFVNVKCTKEGQYMVGGVIRRLSDYRDISNVDTCYITVLPSRSDARLDTLYVKDCTLSPAFHANAYNYSVTVPSNTTDMQKITTAIPHNPKAKVIMHLSALPVGKSQYQILVRSQNNVSWLYYTLSVTRPSNDATLKSLTVDTFALTPAFLPNVFVYDVYVPDSVKNVTIVAAANYDGATVATDWAIPLGDNGGQALVTVTAEDSITERTYTVNIEKQKVNAASPSLPVLDLASQSQPVAEPPYYAKADTTVTGTGSVTIVGTFDTTAIKLPFYADYCLPDSARFAPLIVTCTDIIVKRPATGEVCDYLPEFHPQWECPFATQYVFKFSEDSVDLTFVSYSDSVIPYRVGGLTDYPYSPNGKKDRRRYLKVGRNQFLYTMAFLGHGEASTAAGAGVQTYEMYVERADYTTADATLQSLAVEGYALRQAFTPPEEGYERIIGYKPPVMAYSVTVPYGTERVKIIPEPVQATTGFVIRPAAGFSIDSLRTGDNRYDIVVTAKDSTELIYTLNVYREKSADATLRSLQVGSGMLSPGFLPERTGYSDTVPYAVDSIVITAVKNNTGASVTGDGRRALNVGDNPLSVVVTAEDGTPLIYTLNVYRQSNAFLQSLLLNTGVLSPAFNANTFNYTVTVSAATDSIVFEGVSNNTHAVVTGAGVKRLAVGDNRFIITVIAEDTTVRLPYSIAVHRESDDASLRLLTLDRGYLSPAFHPNIFNYTAAVDGPTDTVLITALTGYRLATVTGDGEQMLAFGRNSLQVTVTAEDSSVCKTYSIDIYRQSNDAGLQSLAVDTGRLSPSFDAGIFEYDILVPSSLSEMVITAETTDSLAAVAGDGRQDLSDGTGIINLTVTAEDGSIGIYTVNVIRISDDATLKRLSVSAGSFPLSMSPAFDASVHSYEVSVPHNLATVVTVGAETSHSLASVAGAGLLALPKGDHAFQVDVTAEYGNRETYELNVVRALPTGIRASGEAVRVYVDGGVLHIHTPVAERIEIYGVSGVRLYASDKAAGEMAVAFGPAAGVWIVRGGSGWVRMLR